MVFLRKRREQVIKRVKIFLKIKDDEILDNKCAFIHLLT